MSFGLLSHGDDGGIISCSFCGEDAAGPCARCRTPVCGDCCVLSEGGSHTWAICRRCDRRGGRTLGQGWLIVGGWLLLPLVILGGLLAILRWRFG
ncbi:MAG TPA: hypothetical protein VHM70_06855 [Polyangiaceae bacterium]|nr:hypothetical protein [Polyangiaceae bacterium]